MLTSDVKWQVASIITTITILASYHIALLFSCVGVRCKQRSDDFDGRLTFAGAVERQLSSSVPLSNSLRVSR